MKYNIKEKNLEDSLKWLKEGYGLEDYGDVVKHLLNEVSELKQLLLCGVSLSAYMVICKPKGKRFAVIAENIGDACDKLEKKGYLDYEFVRSVSFDVLH